MIETKQTSPMEVSFMREVSEDSVYLEYFIPKGSQLKISQWLNL